MDSLTLTKEQLDQMIRHVNMHAPLEACGLLGGKHSIVEKVIEVWNRAQSSVRYQMDPQAQLDAFQWIGAHGLELVGIFHSHPHGPETPSSTDIAEAAYEVVQVILAQREGTWSVRGFWIKNGGFNEVLLNVR
jgi:proteasome lid subunit RPN8/RPN11